VAVIRLFAVGSFHGLPMMKSSKSLHTQPSQKLEWLMKGLSSEPNKLCATVGQG
jgi:hypothetical protein